MWFYRNYTPEYKDSEEYANFIKEKLEDSWDEMYMELNKYPYNCKWLKQNIKTEHFTLFFGEYADVPAIWKKIEKMMKKWFSLWSVPYEEKSVKIEHIHFIKEI